MPTARTKTLKAPKPKAAPARMSLQEAMKALEKAGTAQARKTYARHGAKEPMFGTSFAVIGQLMRKIGVDHELALALWETGNFDARNLAFKIADPARLSAKDLDRWAKDTETAMCASYVSMLAVEGPRGLETATRWLASKDEHERRGGWGVVAQLAARDEKVPDAWFEKRLAEIEKTIHTAPNERRTPMNLALITIGGRSPALRKAALAVAKRIGKVEIDHGDTSCKTPDAGPYIEKMWANSESKGFSSPSAQERNRESPRTRC
jgi:3-methyladenine DNA glycosylase AlkD